MTDHAFHALGADFSRALLLLGETNEIVMLGARMEQRGHRLSRFHRPAIEGFDEEHLVIAAGDPIGGSAVENAIELAPLQRRQRSDLMPLPEPVARGKSPGDAPEIMAGKRKFARRGDPQDAQLRFDRTLYRPIEGDFHFRGHDRGQVPPATPQRGAEQHQALRPARC